MDNNEIYKELGKMQANIDNLQKEKAEIREDIKSLRYDIDNKLTKIGDALKQQHKEINETIKENNKENIEAYKLINSKINELMNDKKFIMGGWKAYAVLFTLIAGAFTFVKVVFDLLKLIP